MLLNDGAKRNRFPYLKIMITPIDRLVINLRQTGGQKYTHAKRISYNYPYNYCFNLTLLKFFWSFVTSKPKIIASNIFLEVHAVRRLFNESNHFRYASEVKKSIESYTQYMTENEKISKVEMISHFYWAQKPDVSMQST